MLFEHECLAICGLTLFRSKKVFGRLIKNLHVLEAGNQFCRWIPSNPFDLNEAPNKLASQGDVCPQGGTHDRRDAKFRQKHKGISNWSSANQLFWCFNCQLWENFHFYLGMSSKTSFEILNNKNDQFSAQGLTRAQ